MNWICHSNMKLYIFHNFLNLAFKTNSQRLLGSGKSGIECLC